jgi:plastocyanin
MGEIHVDCTDGIRVGSFDACEDLDEEYRDLLERYATVENDLQSETETADQFNETREQQREYAALREEFEDTYDEYQAARAAGNDTEARARARELQRLADRIEALGGELAVNFIELDGATDADLSTAAQTINSSTTEVRTIVLEAERESFEATEVNVTVGDNASFAEPETVSGRLTATNGTGIADADIVLTDGAQSFSTTTSANGSYELLYRPTRTLVGTTNLTIQYQPAPDDPFLSTATTEPIEVFSTDSDLRIENSSRQVAFGRQLVVTGDVRAADMPAPAVDVTVRSDMQPLGTTQTNPNGSFRAVAQIPVTMPTGPQTIEIQASEPDRAIGVSRASTELTVVETATQLNITGTVTDGTIDVSGRLTADADAEIGRRPISVQIGNETYDIRTDSDGSYRISGAVSAESAPVTAIVTYNETDTNLGSSRAETRIESDSIGAVAPSTASDPTGNGLLSALRSSPLLASSLGIAVVILIIAIAVAVRRFRNRDTTDTMNEGSRSTGQTEPPVDESGDTSASKIESLLATARSKLQTDPQTTVYASYAAVRTLFDTSADQTHWELYDQQHSSETDRPDEAFYTLTELFERAAFAAEEVETAQAESALQAAERYLETTDSGGSTD